ncbi:hypothetical protein MYX82_04435 [Acidobacteria bacterium AH-259-D05]|nr:hypothetical protein [Acidobacteria bacterium AH-259-D05]
MEIDIKALSELLDLVMTCYENTDRRHQFPEVLKHMEGVVDSLQWKHRLIYQEALWALGRNWDVAASREQLTLLGNVNEVQDPEILKLYLDFNDEDLSFSQKISLIDRILASVSKPVDRLQYRTLKGIQLILIQDIDSGCSEIKEALAGFCNKETGTLTSYENVQLGRSLFALGSFSQDNKPFADARSAYEAALESGDLNTSGVAMIHRSIGDLGLSEGEWIKAKQSYLKSLDYEEDSSTTIQLAQSLVGLQDFSRSIEYLDTLQYESLTRPSVPIMVRHRSPGKLM